MLTDVKSEKFGGVYVLGVGRARWARRLDAAAPAIPPYPQNRFWAAGRRTDWALAKPRSVSGAFPAKLSNHR